MKDPHLPAFTRRTAVYLVRAYQVLVSPLTGPHCRHIPTCSQYAAEAIERFGVLRGGWLAVKRVLRCHPWGSSGYDPVPDEDEND